MPSNSKPGDGERARGRAGRDDHVAAAHLGAVGDAHRAAVGVEHARTGDDRDLAALEQGLEPADEPVDDRLLAHLRLAELDRRGRRVHAELGRVLDGAEDLGGLQELLGRDAAAVQAGASEPVLLDDGDAHAGRRAVERGGVTAGPAAEHDEIEFFGGSFGHDVDLSRRQLRANCTANAARITNPVSRARTM